MKQYLLLLAFFLGGAFSLSAQNSTEARQVLNKVAQTLRQMGGVKASFDVTLYSGNKVSGKTSGDLWMNREKFRVKTAEHSTWFDGKTLWSYMTDSQEVNVSLPSSEELMNINPYLMVNLYKKGYSIRSGTLSSYRGQPVAEIVLTAQVKHPTFNKVILYVDKQTSLPVFIRAEQAKNRTEIVITSFRKGLNLSPSEFVFNHKSYPQAEIIDLR